MLFFKNSSLPVACNSSDFSRHILLSETELSENLVKSPVVTDSNQAFNYEVIALEQCYRYIEQNYNQNLIIYTSLPKLDHLFIVF